MNSRPTPPAKPKTKTQRALDAYASELRRYEMKLAEWQADLEARECDLDTAITQGWADGDDPYDDEVCECGPQDAIDGCECATCGCWRDAHKATMAYERSDAKALNAVQGDEVEFLERMFKLKDKRK